MSFHHYHQVPDFVFDFEFLCKLVPLNSGAGHFNKAEASALMSYFYRLKGRITTIAQIAELFQLKTKKVRSIIKAWINAGMLSPQLLEKIEGAGSDRKAISIYVDLQAMKPEFIKATYRFPMEPKINESEDQSIDTSVDTAPVKPLKNNIKNRPLELDLDSTPQTTLTPIDRERKIGLNSCNEILNQETEKESETECENIFTVIDDSGKNVEIPDFYDFEEDQSQEPDHDSCQSSDALTAHEDKTNDSFSSSSIGIGADSSLRSEEYGKKGTSLESGLACMSLSGQGGSHSIHDPQLEPAVGTMLKDPSNELVKGSALNGADLELPARVPVPDAQHIQSQDVTRLPRPSNDWFERAIQQMPAGWKQQSGTVTEPDDDDVQSKLEPLPEFLLPLPFQADFDYIVCNFPNAKVCCHSKFDSERKRLWKEAVKETDAIFHIRAGFRVFLAFCLHYCMILPNGHRTNTSRYIPDMKRWLVDELWKPDKLEVNFKKSLPGKDAERLVEEYLRPKPEEPRRRMRGTSGSLHGPAFGERYTGYKDGETSTN